MRFLASPGIVEVGAAAFSCPNPALDESPQLLALLGAAAHRVRVHAGDERSRAGVWLGARAELRGS
jgi:hypothetical protein